MKKCFKIITTLCLFTCFVWGAFTACSNSVDSDSPKKEEPAKEPAEELPPEPVEFTITFNANDGSENPATATQKFTEGTAQALKTISELGFSRDGYNFAGWATKADATQADFADGTSYSAKSNATLYALWSQIPMYSVTVTPSTYGEVTASPATAAEGTEITLTAYAYVEYDFKEYTVTDENSNLITVTNGKFIMPACNVTVETIFDYAPIYLTVDELKEFDSIVKELHHEATFIITGEMADTDFTTIRDSLISYYSYEINLDLSGVTGLKAIPDYAFLDPDKNYTGCRCIKSVILPDTITTIGEYAFGESGLTSISIPSSVKTIKRAAFYRCWGLTNVVVPDSVETLGESVFYWCSNLETVVLSNSITTIPSRLVDYCNKLKSVNIPESVTTIGSYVFSGKISEIHIPSSVNSINEYAFNNCSISSFSVSVDNQKYSSDNNILFDKNKTTLIKAYGDVTGKYEVPSTVEIIKDGALSGKGITSLVIPSSVRSIGYGAFGGCKGLTDVQISEGVKSIEHNAFYACTSLESVTLPSSLLTMGDQMFWECHNLKEITVSASNPNYSSIDGILFDKKNKTILCYPATKTDTSYTIPSFVKQIDGQAFCGCKYLTKMIIPEGITNIEYEAFRDCTGLTTVELPATLKRIWHSTFRGCSALSSVTFKDTNNWYISYSSYSYTSEQEIKEKWTLADVSDPNSIATFIVQNPTYWFAKVDN
ncbi:Listeria/Bacterioides repeat-containing protein [Treponema bryantii]|uniref:Listeria/Bacterioides repeat-containing protein n=1 Tax=Treponema bryantii TaxID=163 RepID=A0A1I3IBD5_9SPIR|nr:leucine-rich repeat protein [Treponema bryantii]SFI45150.1 Listeria/Bacterioides repeat-containing protein [Treponema bryantii]